MGDGLSQARAPSAADERKVRMLAWMRNRHLETVNKGTVRNFRQRRIPSSAMPALVTAASRYPGLQWAPKDLLVPDQIPPEGRLPKRYFLEYYGLGKLGWGLYNRFPIDPQVPWDPSLVSNGVFPSTTDGWERPTSDETFVRLRLQGPNPWLLEREAGVSDSTFVVDFAEIFDGILPPVVARFEVSEGQLVPVDITVGDHRHEPGDPTWDNAKRTFNALDIRYVPFVRHLLEVHLIVAQAFALATYALPTWHKLRPFMQFFTYGSIEVNHLAYKGLLAPSSYFIASGFLGVDDVCRLFTNAIAAFDLDRWIAPRDIERRGLHDIPGHPYVDDALLVWPHFVQVVERHLDERGFDDEAIAADLDLQSWYFTLAKILPNVEPSRQPLDRRRLVDLCTALLWNNVVHEICGDLSPILGSQDAADKSITNLAQLRRSVGEGELNTDVERPSMADVFLMDQASWVSRFNVGGNNILRINAAREVDDPKLRMAIEDLQRTLRGLEPEIVERNDGRKVRFNRMLPSNWEASISF